MTAANTSNFPPEKYIGIASNHLVVYAIYSLQNDGDEISAEDIISACFMLFPRKFSLRTYPQWPDSALVGRRLHDCEKNGWLIARIDTGFKLTALGTRLAEKVAKELGVEIPRKEKPKQVHKLQVAGAEKPVGELQVDKLKVTEIVEPAPVTTKPVEKIVAPAAKPALVKSKPAKKEKKKQVDKLQVTKVLKPAPAAKPAPVKPEPAKKAEKKQAGKLQVTEAIKPAPVKAETLKKEKTTAVKAPKPVEKKAATTVTKTTPTKLKPAEKATKKRVEKLQVAETAKLAPIKAKTVEKAKSPVVVEAPKTAEKKAAAPVAKPVPAQPKPAEKATKKRVAKLQVAEAAKLAPIKAQTVEKAKAPAIEAPKPAEKKAAVTAAKPTPVKPPKVEIVHRPPSVVPVPSPEEKAKAGKFVKMMEGSDAYRLYKKNGANANIGEFDFRSLLLCTMESSYETLARNVDLFKGYAEIHNRQDLVAFLAVCREKFAHLLASEKKAVRKLR